MLRHSKFSNVSNYILWCIYAFLLYLVTTVIFYGLYEWKVNEMKQKFHHSLFVLSKILSEVNGRIWTKYRSWPNNRDIRIPVVPIIKVALCSVGAFTSRHNFPQNAFNCAFLIWCERGIKSIFFSLFTLIFFPISVIPPCPFSFDDIFYTPSF